MKKFGELLQTISAHLVNKNEEEYQGQYLQRKDHCTDDDPGCTHQELNSLNVENKPADAARKLWCNAQHF